MQFFKLNNRIESLEESVLTLSKGKSNGLGLHTIVAALNPTHLCEDGCYFFAQL